jgi:hypothetical protein
MPSNLGLVPRSLRNNLLVYKVENLQLLGNIFYTQSRILRIVNKTNNC